MSTSFLLQAAEQAAAKSKYAGKLTMDFLEERVGHRFFEHLRELDLSGFRLRDLGDIFHREEFAHLRELNLDNNFLTDVSSLARLTNLCALRLNQNRLESHPLFDEAAAAAEYGAAGGGDKAPPCYDSLEVLQMGHCGITSLPSLGLHHMRYSLRVLFLQDNDLTKVEGLDTLANLQELVLDRNKIKFLDVNSLTGLVHLQVRSLASTGQRAVVRPFRSP